MGIIIIREGLMWGESTWICVKHSGKNHSITVSPGWFGLFYLALWYQGLKKRYLLSLKWKDNHTSPDLYFVFTTYALNERCQYNWWLLVFVRVKQLPKETWVDSGLCISDSVDKKPEQLASDSRSQASSENSCSLIYTLIQQNVITLKFTKSQRDLDT